MVVVSHDILSPTLSTLPSIKTPDPQLTECSGCLAETEVIPESYLGAPDAAPEGDK
jgi:hypothetical protein